MFNKIVEGKTLSRTSRRAAAPLALTACCTFVLLWNPRGISVQKPKRRLCWTRSTPSAPVVLEVVEAQSSTQDRYASQEVEL